MAAPIDRKALRQTLRTGRRALPPQVRMSAADALAARLLALPFAPERGLVAGYWAMDGEIALHAWQVRLPGAVRYCLPVLGDDNLLRFAPWRTGDALVSNRFGIPEPDVPADALFEAHQLSLVVAPLVGFDARGNRLGMGGGWYDRSFAFRRVHPAPPFFVGAAFASQQVPALDPQAWDVVLDAVCTDTSTIDLRRTDLTV